MKRTLIFLILLWFLSAGALPVYANNPPLPDGILFLALLFPVVMLAFRLAEVSLPSESRAARIWLRVLLGVAFFLTLAGTEIALIPLLFLFCYGLWRAIQVARHGKGIRRFVVAASIVVFTSFVVANYVASLSWGPSAAPAEASAVGRLRDISVSERLFQSSNFLDANGNGKGEFGSIEQLRKADFLDARFDSENAIFGYRYYIELSGDAAKTEKEFFAYAIPDQYGDSHPALGISILRVFLPRTVRARRSFAIDENGKMRFADLGKSRIITREEVKSWNEL